jgi:hypothetical protein
VTERGITLTFATGALVDLLDEEAAWLRDELVRGEYTSPKRDAGTVVDRALGAIDEDTEPSPADMTPANVVELAWALRGMLDHDSDRFIGSPLLMHLRDLLFIELERGRENDEPRGTVLREAERMEVERSLPFALVLPHAPTAAAARSACALQCVSRFKSTSRRALQPSRV